MRAAAIWGRFVSPKAPNRLKDPVRVAVEIIFFGGAAPTATIFGTAAGVSLVLMFVFGQRGL